jgi:hypothetical protein
MYRRRNEPNVVLFRPSSLSKNSRKVQTLNRLEMQKPRPRNRSLIFFSFFKQLTGYQHLPVTNSPSTLHSILNIGSSYTVQYRNSKMWINSREKADKISGKSVFVSQYRVTKQIFSNFIAADNVLTFLYKYLDRTCSRKCTNRILAKSLSCSRISRRLWNPKVH